MADLSFELLGMRFRNPVIPAAGPNVGSGECLRRAAEGGAGALLAKTVSVEAARVPRPDMVKVGKLGMVNAELWTELPLEQWLDVEFPKARRAADEHAIPLIGSVGYTPDELRRVGPKVEAAGVDAIEFTIHYLDPARIVETARALRESVTLPIIAKFSPHKGDLGELAKAVEPYVDAFACINSVGPTLVIDPERNEPRLGSRDGYGWLSGPPIKPIALRCVHQVARVTRKPVFGIGGVASGADVVEFLMAGASLVEVCTTVLYYGHGTYGRIAAQLRRWLDEHGYAHVHDVRGRFLRLRQEEDDR